MGNKASTETTRASSRPSLTRISSMYEADLESSFVIVSNETVEVLEYDPLQSYMVAYGIDTQTSPQYSHKSLGGVTILDAKQISLAAIDKGILPKENVQLYGASTHPDKCTMAGMKQSFQKQARNVGREGLFLFHFSGHGILVNNSWGVAPSDFDLSRSTFISGYLFNEWLNEIDCQAKYVIFVFDCCYAGGLANELTSSILKLRQGVFVLTSCTAYELTLNIDEIGHSIFTYFLSYSIRAAEISQGKLPISKIFDQCATLCTALSSLIIQTDPSYGLKFGTMVPQLRYFIPDHAVGINVQDSLKIMSLTGDEQAYLTSLGRYNFVVKYVKTLNLKMVELDELAMLWLENITDEKKSPLKELAREGVLKQEVLSAALGSVLWSIASIQVCQDRDNAHHASQFLMAFLHAAIAFDTIHQTFITLSHLLGAWEWYTGVIVHNSLPDDDLHKLGDAIRDDMKGTANVEEETTDNSEGDPMLIIRVRNLGCCNIQSINLKVDCLSLFSASEKKQL